MRLACEDRDGSRGWCHLSMQLRRAVAPALLTVAEQEGAAARDRRTAGGSVGVKAGRALCCHEWQRAALAQSGWLGGKLAANSGLKRDTDGE